MDVAVHDFWFHGLATPPATASPGTGPWTKADTSANGNPTLAASGGFMVGTLDNTNEVQNLCLYFGDSLSFDIDDLLSAEFWIKTSGDLVNTDSLAFGLASARNDAIDSIADHASFRVLVSDGTTQSVYCETDDATNDNDDKSTGLVLGTTLKRFVIEFGTGVISKSAPAGSVGGKADVLFSMDNARGQLTPVCRATQFDMSNYTAGLQPYVQIQKTSATTTPSFRLRRVRITERV